MALTRFKQILKWNNERGLLSKGYTHKNEVSFIVEELIEATVGLESKPARRYAKWVTTLVDWIPGALTTKEEKVDAYADIIVFATGALAKLGYDPDKVMDEVLKELNDRKGQMVGGKFVKDPQPHPYIADFTDCKI